MDPTLAGFIAFVRNQGFSTTAVPDTSPFLVWAYGVAVELVNLSLQQASPLIYMLAVYNLAMSNLVNYAEDDPGDSNKTFSGFRTKFNLRGAIFGEVTSTSDEGTSVSVEVPDFVKQLSLSDLQYLKDPWGRTYVGFAQRCGSIWGLT